MDTSLWLDESDCYTSRAIKLHGHQHLYGHEQTWAKEFYQLVTEDLNIALGKVLDIGCAYGATSIELAKLYPGASFIGIDPGKESIALAETHSTQLANCIFTLGHSHNIDMPENSVDVIILRMVLQWVPRKFLLQTIAEIDRVLRPGGIIWLQEFSPALPITSKSKHNNEVMVFKQKYENLFLSLPWYQCLYKKVITQDTRDDHVQSVNILQKNDLKASYIEKSDPTMNISQSEKNHI